MNQSKKLAIVALLSAAGVGSVALSEAMRPMPALEVLNASRPDGRVVMGYTFSRATHWLNAGDQMDFNGAEAAAVDQCKAWGYSGAEVVEDAPVTACDVRGDLSLACFAGKEYETYKCGVGDGR